MEVPASLFELGVGTEYYLFGGAGLISLLAFGGLILAPALAAYGRGWEKLAATFVSLFVLAALVLIGLAIGAAIVYYWNDISDVFTGALTPS